MKSQTPTLPINLYDKQHDFFEAVRNKNGEKFICFLGGIGSGKTFIGGLTTLVEAQEGAHILAIGPTYRHLEQIMIASIVDVLTKAGHPFTYNKSDMVLHYGKGQIIGRTAENVEFIRGLHVDSAWIDEAALCKDELFDIVLGRIRRGEKNKLFLTTTPRGKNGYVYEKFHEPGADYRLIVSRTEDNPFLPTSYIQSLKDNYSEIFAAQELHAEFIDFDNGILKRDWFDVVDSTPAITQSVRYWDLAASTKQTADYTVGCKLGTDDKDFFILDVKRVKTTPHHVKQHIFETAQIDGTQTVIGIEQNAFQIAIVEDLQRDANFSQFTIKGITTVKDKVSRCQPWAARLEAGIVKLRRGHWTNEFINEACQFPNGKHDDQVDAMSGAWQMLAVPPCTPSIRWV